MSENGGDLLGGYLQHCAICKKEIYCRGEWGYKAEVNKRYRYYCSYSHYRQGQRAEEERKQRIKEKRKQSTIKRRPATHVTTEQEKEIRRLYNAGVTGYRIAQKMQISQTIVYKRINKWKDEE